MYVKYVSTHMLVYVFVKVCRWCQESCLILLPPNSLMQSPSQTRDCLVSLGCPLDFVSAFWGWDYRSDFFHTHMLFMWVLEVELNGRHCNHWAISSVLCLIFIKCSILLFWKHMTYFLLPSPPLLAPPSSLLLSLPPSIPPSLFFFNLDIGFAMLPRLALSSWAQASFQSQCSE